MVGTISQAGSLYSKGSYGELTKVVFGWTSDASGNATVTTADKVSGRLICAQHVLQSGGSAPTDLYDVTVNNDDGMDILGGTGANITTATGKSSQVISSGIPLIPMVESTLALSVSNAGSAKVGKLVLIFDKSCAKLATQG